MGKTIKLLDTKINNESILYEKYIGGGAYLGSTITLNTSWREIGHFNKLLIQLRYAGWNEYTSCEFSYYDLTSGNNVYDGKRNSNVYSTLFNLLGNTQFLSIIPSTNIGENTITINGNSQIYIEQILVNYL